MRRGGRWWKWAGIGLVVVVAVVVIDGVVTRPNWQAHPIVGVEGAADSNVLEVGVEHGACATGSPRVDAQESDEVVLTASYDVGRMSCDGALLRSTVTVELGHQLGERTLVADTHGQGLDCEIDGRDDEPCIPLAVAD